MIQKTLVLIKPDAMKRRLAGEILRRFELKGLRIAALKMLHMDQALARRHYVDHVDKDFYPDLQDFITSGPCLAMVLEGEEAVAVTRRLMGATDSAQADSGTIRGDLSCSKRANLVHGSDSPHAAEREIAIFFTAEEIHPET
ncbi:nucleoside-diphosphate kinase [bacterium]|nr:nucleoside-diphosphate kinase [bacterium]